MRLYQTKIITLVIAILAVTLLIETTFRIRFARTCVPRTDAEFLGLIACYWPKDIRKDNSTYRILNLSDSFGIAGGYKNYIFLLESKLQKKFPSLEAINFSHPEYQPSEELLLLKRFAKRFRPNIVLFGFFVGNDFEIFSGELYRYRGLSMRKQPGLVSFAPQNLLFVQWLNRCRVWIEDVILQKIDRMRNAPTGSFSQEMFFRIESRRIEICRKEHHPKKNWGKTIRLLEAIREESLLLGAEFVLVLHPDQFQVEPGLRQQILKKYRLNAQDYDFALPQEFLKKFCADRKIPCLDLLPAFKAIGSQDSLYEFYNTHYNKKGNLLAAETIYDFLLNQGLIQTTSP